MEVELTSIPDKKDDEFIISKTREFNSAFVENDALALSVYLREEGGIIGGLVARTYFNWLHVDYLWVEESHRKKSYGSLILNKAESEAKSRGCYGSTLDTYSFQALEFY